MSLLNAEQIGVNRKSIPNWAVHSNIISRTFEFKEFVQSIEFVNRVAKIAEENNHHPDIDIRWNKVMLTLTTHDAGSLTKKDFTLAQRCDEIFFLLTKP